MSYGEDDARMTPLEGAAANRKPPIVYCLLAIRNRRSPGSRARLNGSPRVVTDSL